MQDDDDVYASAMGGSLKLKGVVKKDKKKKKKKKGKGTKRKLEEATVVPKEEPLEAVVAPTLTPAEARHLELKKKREEQRLAKVAAKSHRERVAEYNAYLAGLSEHHDIPKVSRKLSFCFFGSCVLFSHPMFLSLALV